MMLTSVILPFLVSLGVSAFLIPSIIRIAAVKNLMDEPDDFRKVHSNKTPTLGGVAIFAGTVFSFSFFNDYLNHDSPIRFITSGLILLFFAGIKDDILLLSPIKKLLVQVLSALLITLLGKLYFTNLWGMFEIYEISPFLGIALTVLIIVTVINAFNLIDGLNGLASGLGLISCLFFGCWFAMTGTPAFSILSFSLAGSLLGFMFYNFPKGRIFMGDTGSMILGFIISILAIRFVENNRVPGFQLSPYYVKAAPGIAVAVVMIPLIDLVRVFFLRAIQGRNPLQADRNHIHHLILDLGISPTLTTLLIYILAMGILGIALELRHLRSMELVIILMGIYGVLYGSYYLVRRRLQPPKRA